MAKRNVTLEDLKFSRDYILNECIATEGVAEFFSTSNAVKKLADMSTQAKNFIAKTFSSLSIYFGGKKALYPYTLQFAEQVKYMDVVKQSIAVPEGFIGSMPEYTSLLLEGNLMNLKVINEVVKPFNLYIAKLIANPSLLQSSIYDYTSDVKQIEKFKKEAQKHMSSRKHVLLQFGKVYKNMQQLKDQQPILVNLTESVGSQDPKDVKVAVDDLYKNLNKVVELIESRTNNLQPSRTVITSISNILYELGERVEFYVAVNTMSNSLIHACNKNEDLYKAWIDEL